jgi:hypothetical protein
MADGTASRAAGVLLPTALAIEFSSSGNRVPIARWAGQRQSRAGNGRSAEARMLVPRPERPGIIS